METIREMPTDMRRLLRQMPDHYPEDPFYTRALPELQEIEVTMALATSENCCLEKLRDTVTGISALHKSLLDESLASSPTHRNSFSEIYRMSTQAMAMKKEEMVSELKTLPPCTRTDCNEQKIPTTLVVEEINSNDPISG
ncbi:hypothetical protein TNIN_299551 [Trichonephila inaurata madagascariensis]|uniref:Uncharacterized protein n=1 Tax=Trichonephila inaurata madagascariensis TaxID=2747483 RepID=A0A8X6IID1_9ARAC|nr:hypothetical protein TNIN_299551 [Trichonephila inaurata madagascariensis]